MPLQFDLPLEKLAVYQGINPKPDDHEEYWDKALDEVKNASLNKRMVSAEFTSKHASCYNLYFSGTDHARIHAKLLIPKRSIRPCPALLNFHGYTMSSADWHELLHLAGEGFAVAALDCRGQAGRSEDPGGVPGYTYKGQIIRGLDGKPEDLYFRKVFQDTVQLARIVSGLPEVDSKRLGAFGGSQGGALTIACAALVPEIQMLATAFPFLTDLKRIWQMDLSCGSTFSELNDYFRRFDPTHSRQEEIFQRLGYIDIQHLAPRVKGEVLWAIGLADQICPPSTQFATYNKIQSPKRMIQFPQFGHEKLPGFDDQVFQFFRKLLTEEEKEH